MSWYECYKYVVEDGNPLGNPGLMNMLQASKHIHNEMNMDRIIPDKELRARLQVLENQIDEQFKKEMGGCNECSI